MLVKNATAYDIEQAAAAVGVSVYNLRASGKGWRFQLHTCGSGPKYGRRSARARQTPTGGEYFPRIPAAVCWHGHRDFMRALYARERGAVIETALAKYTGAEHFEQTHGATGGSWPYMGYESRAPFGCECAS